MPLFSIIIPVKNRERLLRETLHSVQSQSFSSWECLTVDDGSTDDSLSIAREHSQVDNRFSYHRRETYSSAAGASVCRNVGMSKSCGTYLIFLDSDDLLHPGALEYRASLLGNNSLDFVVTAASMFRLRAGDQPSFWNSFDGRDDLERFLELDVPWQTASATWSRSFIDVVGVWNEQIPSWQDWDQHIRALLKKPLYQKYPVADLFVRVHQDTIGSESLTVNHLRSHANLICNLAEMLTAHDLAKHRTRLAALGFWICKKISQNRNRRLASAAWSRIAGICQVNKLHSWAAHMALVSPIPRLNAKIMRYLAEQDPNVFRFTLRGVGRSIDTQIRILGQ